MTPLIFLTLGMLVGAGAYGFLQSTEGQWALGTVVAGVAGFGLAAGAVAVYARLWMTRKLDTWQQGRAQKMYEDAMAAAADPRALPEKLAANRENIADLGKLALGFILANQSLAYVAMALGGVVSVATLLTAYVQIERMEQQNALIETQNNLAEASRRASLNFELSNILERLDDKGSVDDILTARISALTQSLRPYRLLNDDGTLSEPISPERAQLLLSLLAAGVHIPDLLDAGATFAASGMGAVTLDGARLDGIDLSDADLSTARMREVSVAKADFTGARLPPYLDFTPKSFAGVNLTDATVPEVGWLSYQIGRLVIDSPDVNDPEDDIFGTPRPANVSLLFTESADGFARTRWIARDDLATLLDYSEHDGRLIRDLSWRVSDSILRQTGATLDMPITLPNLSNLRASQTQLERVLTSDPVRRFPSWQAVSAQNGTWPALTVTGHPRRDEYFDIFVTLELPLPEDADLRALSPGGYDKVLRVNRLPDGSAYDLSGRVFAGSDLRYVDFGTADLGGADLRDTLLPQANFITGANLAGLRLDGAKAPMDWQDSLIPNLGLIAEKRCPYLNAPDSDCHFMLKDRATP